MKTRNFHIAAMLILLPFASEADSVDDALSAANRLEAETKSIQCANEGKLAQLIMVRRQNGESPSEVIQGVTPLGSLDVKTAVKEAFAAPRVQTKAAFLRTSEEFRNRYEIACLDRTN